MNFTKYFHSALLAASLLTLGTGCSKKLDQQPFQSINAGSAIQSAADVETALIGAYSIMGGGALYGTNFNMIPELLASDGYCSWRGTFQGFRQIGARNMTRDNSEASRTWIAGYRAINAANIVLQNLPLVTDTDLRDQLEGEARWIRAMMHFELVRLYALPYDAAVSNNTQLGVPIMTQATLTETDAFQYPARATVQQVYDAVIADLTTAISKLPSSNGTRISSPAASAFLARVLLQKGDYAGARDAANDAIPAFRMNAAVLAAFTNKNTAESVFEVQQNDQNNAGTSNDGLATFYASLPGVGRADVRMNAGFVGSYPTGDLRSSEWYYVGTGARPGNLYCRKWNSFSQNIPVMRVAELYLIRAECNLRLSTSIGDTPEADLARVRNSLRTNSAAISSPTLADVLAERRFELAFEGYRVHEIRRLKLATGSFAWNSPRLVFPIPQREIDANPSLVQNPGY